MLLIQAGLFAGALHVLAGPDHLAAVGRFSVEGKANAWKHGLMWGLGHSVGLALIGMIFLLFRESGLIAGISMGAEKLVGVALVWVGVSGVLGAMRKNLEKEGKQSRGTLLGFGVLHGSAGANHLIAMIPLLGAESVFETVAYILCYCIGCVVVMAGFTHGLGWMAQSLGANREGVSRLLVPCSVIAFAVGCWWLIQPV